MLKKYQELENRGLLWEMFNMEIRATTIIFAKRKARQKRNEEKELLLRFNSLEEQLRLNTMNQQKPRWNVLNSNLPELQQLRRAVQSSAAKLGGINLVKKTASTFSISKTETRRKKILHP